ncbi:MAG: hypothetical protein N3F11_02705 [Casimicrobiaceae bacterium]|nr:hypothetical protein [Casimicrobiaceae bacterium]
MLDAKSLAITRTDERFDFRRLINSDATALNVLSSIPAEALARELEQLVETLARRLIVDRPSTIEIGRLRPGSEATLPSR